VALEYALGREEYSPAAKEVRSDTIYDIASLANVVGVLSAAMLAVDSGSLLLDASAHDYLPEFHRSDDGVRVRDILNRITNKTGIKSDESDPDVLSLKEIVSRAVGLPLDRFLAARLFSPLGMKTASFTPPKHLRKRRDLRSIYCSIRDLAVFSQMLLNRGVYDHKRIFNPTTFARFAGTLSQSMQVLGLSKPAESGWTERLFSSTALGYGDPSGSLLWINPERQLFIVLLIAGQRPAPDESRVAAFQELLLESILGAIAVN
jgi:CubicO group peptidase (beta-lactamase class C family)